MNTAQEIEREIADAKALLKEAKASLAAAESAKNEALILMYGNQVTELIGLLRDRENRLAAATAGGVPVQGPLNESSLTLSQFEQYVDASSNRIMTYINESLAPLKKSMDFVISEATDPWERIHSEASSIGKRRDGHLLKPISKYYGSPKSDYCMVLGPVLNQTIISAHLWPQCTGGRGLDTFGLRSDDVKNPRNFLRLHKTIEKAFDRKRLTFLPADDFVNDGSEPLSLKVVILDPDLHQEQLTYNDSAGNTVTKCMGDLHNAPFHFKFPIGKFPFLRIIACHASRAHQKAYDNMWIQDTNIVNERRARAFELARLSLSQTNDESFVMKRFFTDV